MFNVSNNKYSIKHYSNTKSYEIESYNWSNYGSHNVVHVGFEPITLIVVKIG